MWIDEINVDQHFCDKVAHLDTTDSFFYKVAFRYNVSVIEPNREEDASWKFLYVTEKLECTLKRGIED